MEMSTRIDLNTQKPFLIRAMYDWMITYGLSPQLQISPLIKGCILPAHLTNRDEVLLSISPKAVTNLRIEGEGVNFHAIFNTQPFKVSIPMNSVGSITSIEENVGYLFDISHFLPKPLPPENTIAKTSFDPTELPSQSIKRKDSPSTFQEFKEDDKVISSKPEIKKRLWPFSLST